MVIRGAPAIGVAAAMGVALGVQEGADFETVCKTLAATRPTAVNLFWGIERMRKLYARLQGASREELVRSMIEEAKQIRLEDIAICQAIGRHGEPLVPDGKTVLTHCNAGALATAGYGTALGVIRAAVSAGKKIDVFADETRPFLQGARLTAWELQQDGIATTVITDNMAGHFLHSGRIGCVVVGADRIAANGDVANKIGTYSVAVLAKENGIPFYVAAPVSTFDLTLASGDLIPIEQRSPDEVTHVFGVPVAPEVDRRREPGVRRDSRALRHRDRMRAGRGPRALRRIAAQRWRRHVRVRFMSVHFARLSIFLPLASLTSALSAQGSPIAARPVFPCRIPPCGSTISWITAEAGCCWIS